VSIALLLWIRTPRVGVRKWGCEDRQGRQCMIRREVDLYPSRNDRHPRSDRSGLMETPCVLNAKGVSLVGDMVESHKLSIYYDITTISKTEERYF
jgi:hypothetical protein